MIKLDQKNKRLIFQRRDELTIIEPYGENCLRCRMTRNGMVSDEKWTLQDIVTKDSCKLEGDAMFATITNGDMSATVETGQPWYGGIISYYKKSA